MGYFSPARKSEKTGTITGLTAYFYRLVKSLLLKPLQVLENQVASQCKSVKSFKVMLRGSFKVFE